MNIQSETYLQSNIVLIRHIRIFTYLTKDYAKTNLFLRSIVGLDTVTSQRFPLDSMLFIPDQSGGSGSGIGADHIMYFKYIWSPYLTNEHLEELFHHSNQAWVAISNTKYTNINSQEIAILHQHQLCFHWMKIFTPQLSTRFANFQLQCYAVDLCKNLNTNHTKTMEKLDSSLKRIISTRYSEKIPAKVHNGDSFKSTSSQIRDSKSENQKFANFSVTNKGYSIQYIVNELFNILIESKNRHLMIQSFIDKNAIANDHDDDDYDDDDDDDDGNDDDDDDNEDDDDDDYDDGKGKNRNTNSGSTINLSVAITQYLTDSKPMFTDQKTNDSSKNEVDLSEFVAKLNRAFRWNIGIIVFEERSFQKGTWISGDFEYTEQSDVDPIFLILLRNNSPKSQDYQILTFEPLEQFSNLWRYRQQQYFEMLWPLFRIKHVFENLYNNSIRDKLRSTMAFDSVKFPESTKN